ncbi:reverse transcriptase domain-containing protein [Nocardiopsis chromatogenes]|uniref:reverse transcriptase domain-containing protein n=1 Tax=Nocardiopsis chromatogenes TaxID=280239 RepID=UPI000379A1D1|nr:reverse transcriptase domain-containing protein [Nocardiopsis chromatogenes]
MIRAAHSMMPLLTDPARLKRAARACMRRSGGPGIDGVTWADYRRAFDDRLKALAQRLADGTWRPSPVRFVSWPSWGKELHIGVPTVEDRIVHRALRNALEPLLDTAAYPPWLFGWRPRRGRTEAVAAAARHLYTGAPWVADLDIAQATAGAATEELIDILAAYVHDGSFLARLREVLDGLPSPLYPGSGLSPRLTNVRLLPVDHAPELKERRTVRLTDNYAVFAASRREAEAAMKDLVSLLAARGLAPNPQKTKVWKPNPEDLFLAG